MASYCRPSIHLSVTLRIVTKQYILQQVSEQVNRKCPKEQNLITINPNTDRIPSNSPPLKPEMLVPSGKYVKNILWTSEPQNMSTSRIACCEVIPDNVVQSALSWEQLSFLLLLKQDERHKRTCFFLQSGVGTTVFRRTRNFEASRGICPFPRNFYVFTEFCGIRYWTVM